MEWTKEQQNAIYETGENILVAAAAGSGKTAVLVERIINKVIKENINIDNLLIVTFTNAAASEMRERILEAIYKKIDEEPHNKNLQKQIILLNKANISTIHSFCLEVIRNNFFEIDMPANFSVGDETQIEIIKQDSLEELFESKYEKQDEDFLKLLDNYGSYKEDESLKQIVLKIYSFIQSCPFPQQWLDEKVEMYNKQEKDIFDTVWGKIIKEEVQLELTKGFNLLQIEKTELSKDPSMTKFYAAICNDIDEIEKFQKGLTSWDDLYEAALRFDFERWPQDRNANVDLKERAKKIRTRVKDSISKNVVVKINGTSEEIFADLKEMYEILKSLKNLVFEFDEIFKKRKKEKNVIDYSDIEHLALKLLVKKDDEGKVHKTEIAKRYQEKFKEIAIDEYQDSNEVQEFILSSVSKDNNIFMVGDVKQSIYKFRQARPELFLEKYKKYQNINEKIVDGVKIKLFKNFRSRKNVLDVTNLIFENIMSEELGDIDYNESEYLNLGANYIEPTEKIDYAGKAEIYIIDKEPNESEEKIQAFITDNDEQEEPSCDNDEYDYIEDIMLEAKFVAKKIEELLKSDYQVYDRKTAKYRKIEYKDIVVLLRSTSVPAPIFEKEISNLNLPVFSDISAEYLGSIEIQIIMSILKIIDNPLQDIPLVTILKSSIWNFTDNELLEIRLVKQKAKYYEALIEAEKSDLISINLKKKITKFLAQIEEWRKKEKYLGLDELIWDIYMETGFYNYVSLMSNGELRTSNLKLLFEKSKQYEKASFKGLFNFITFIKRLQDKQFSNDMSSAKIIGENDNVIRIMSIHKSKGLEFPVVFLSNIGRQFNTKELSEKILLHQDLGVGVKYINYEKNIEYPTVTRESIGIKSKEESLSEEMRVLYVALTRAKEKLIITGLSKKVKKDLEKKRELLKAYKNITDSVKINKSVIVKSKNYLDWIVYVYLNNEKSKDKVMDLKILNKNEVIDIIKQEEVKDEDFISKINSHVKEKNFNVEDIFNWEYAYKKSIEIPTKTSVSKIKQIQKVDEKSILKETVLNDETVNNIQMAIPKFLSGEVKISTSQKGSLMHLILQKLDESKSYTKEDIKNIVQDLLNREIIIQSEAEAINVEKVYEYTQTDFFKNLKYSKMISKETAFYTNISSKEIFNEADENVLVQGIIDLYFVNNDDKMVLVDYKTDKVENETELIERYKIQLDLYKTALEKSLNKKVDKVLIYSLYKMKEVEIG